MLVQTGSYVGIGVNLLSGARAQEESLCRASALYLCLDGQPMYDWHATHRDPLYANWSLYSPDVPISPPCLCQAYGVLSLRRFSKPPLISCGNESGSAFPAAVVVDLGVGRPGAGVGVGTGRGVCPGGRGVGAGVVLGGDVGIGGGVDGGGGTYAGPEKAKSSRCTVNAESACISRLTRAC